MSLTRRSFVKKSSYSVAAVTILGAGVGLGNLESHEISQHLLVRLRYTLLQSPKVFTYPANNLGDAMSKGILKLLEQGKVDDPTPQEIREWGKPSEYESPDEGEIWVVNGGQMGFARQGGGIGAGTWTATFTGDPLTVDEILLKKK